MSGFYFIDTMGCQMNERDSETIAGVLEGLGFRRADRAEDAEVIVLNTCAVREKPVHKVFSKLGDIRKIKERRPETLVVVAGCVAQVSAETLRRRAPFVDVIIGPRNLAHLAEAVSKRAPGPRQWIHEHAVVPEGLPCARLPRVGAFVNISYGCDNFCTYCIVPYARGREQSRSPEAILAEVETAVSQGFREVTLLGQNVNSYRGTSSTVGGAELDFPELLRLIGAVPGLWRLRFTTSHPKDLSPRLLDAMAETPAVCEHLHLPLQAGDDEVLARMGRGYTLAEYLDLVRAARQRIPGIAITTDVMVGFPGESEEQFQRTLAAFEQIRFDQAFMFIYSDRPGTPAANMPGKVSEAEKHQRLSRLAALQNEIGRQINSALVGYEHEVLVEGPDPKSPDKARGRTRTGKLAIFDLGPQNSDLAPQDLVGQLVAVRAEHATLWGFTGVMTKRLTPPA